MSWSEMKGLKMSEFTRLYKCAAMLSARERLQLMDITQLANFEKPARERIVAELKAASNKYLETKLKDYREVFKNVAKRMMNGR